MYDGAWVCDVDWRSAQQFNDVEQFKPEGHYFDENDCTYLTYDHAEDVYQEAKQRCYEVWQDYEDNYAPLPEAGVNLALYNLKKGKLIQLRWYVFHSEPGI